MQRLPRVGDKVKGEGSWATDGGCTVARKFSGQKG